MTDVRLAVEAYGKELEDRESQQKRIENPFSGFTMTDNYRSNNRGDRGRCRGGRGGRGGRGRGSKLSNFRNGYPERDETRENDMSKQSKSKCTFCGKSCPAVQGSEKEKCYAWNKECKKCGKKGHFQDMCKSKKTISNSAQATQSDRYANDNATSDFH